MNLKDVYYKSKIGTVRAVTELRSTALPYILYPTDLLIVKPVDPAEVIKGTAHGKFSDQRDVLGHVPHPRSGNSGALAARLSPQDPHLAAVETTNPDDAGQQGGLAASARPQQSVSVSRKEFPFAYGASSSSSNDTTGRKTVETANISFNLAISASIIVIHRFSFEISTYLPIYLPHVRTSSKNNGVYDFPRGIVISLDGWQARLANKASGTISRVRSLNLRGHNDHSLAKAIRGTTNSAQWCLDERNF